MSTYYHLYIHVHVYVAASNIYCEAVQITQYVCTYIFSSLKEMKRERLFFMWLPLMVTLLLPDSSLLRCTPIRCCHLVCHTCTIYPLYRVLMWMPVTTVGGFHYMKLATTDTSVSLVHSRVEWIKTTSIPPDVMHVMIPSLHRPGVLPLGQWSQCEWLWRHSLWRDQSTNGRSQQWSHGYSPTLSPARSWHLPQRHQGSCYIPLHVCLLCMSVC